ncbi:MAG: C40 family peptidase, partial [Clostridiales bacterium]|nr:C40 family peptidase [Clostridiales bacterium]
MKKIAIASIMLLFGVTQTYAKQRDKLAVALTKSSDIVFTKSNHKLTKDINKVIRTAKKYLGTKYKFGGTTRRGIDCSAFTKVVMKHHGKTLPRTANQQASSGKHINKKDLRKGDLVFFKNTDKRRIISHVGIYLGNGKFIHASSGAGRVTITKLNKAYY